MNTSPKAVRFDDDKLWVSLADGRTIAAPLAWFPRLLQATPVQAKSIDALPCLEVKKDDLAMVNRTSENISKYANIQTP